MTTLGAIVAIVGAVAGTAGIVWGYMRTCTDRRNTQLAEDASERDDVRVLIEIKDQMISSLRESNDELRGQIAAALDRESEWFDERAEYRARLKAVEDAYRQIVVAVVNAGICTLAPSCANYVPPASAPPPPEILT